MPESASGWGFRKGSLQHRCQRGDEKLDSQCTVSTTPGRLNLLIPLNAQYLALWLPGTGFKVHVVGFTASLLTPSSGRWGGGYEKPPLEVCVLGVATSQVYLPPLQVLSGRQDWCSSDF